MKFTKTVFVLIIILISLLLIYFFVPSKTPINQQCNFPEENVGISGVQYYCDVAFSKLNLTTLGNQTEIESCVVKYNNTQYSATNLNEKEILDLNNDKIITKKINIGNNKAGEYFYYFQISCYDKNGTLYTNEKPLPSYSEYFQLIEPDEFQDKYVNPEITNNITKSGIIIGAFVVLLTTIIAVFKDEIKNVRRSKKDGKNANKPAKKNIFVFMSIFAYFWFFVVILLLIR